MKKFNLHKWLQEQRDLKSKRPINPSDKEDKKFGVFARYYEPRKGEEKDEPLKRGDEDDPTDGCEGIPIDCPPDLTFNYDTCKCEGPIKGKEPDRWTGVDPSSVNPVCKDPQAVNYVPEGPDTPIHTDNNLCWYLTGCEDPLSATYYCDNVENVFNSTMTPDGTPIPPPPEGIVAANFQCSEDGELPEKFTHDQSWCTYPAGSGMVGGNEGCTDPDAINYDPNALLNDGSCIYMTCTRCPEESLAYDWQYDITGIYDGCANSCQDYNQLGCYSYDECYFQCSYGLMTINGYCDYGGWDDSNFGDDDDWIDYCFVAGTLVTMADGTTKPIEEIKIDDKVKSWNEESKELSEATVTELKQPSHSDMVIIEFDHTTNKNTFDHPYWVVGKGWSSYKPQLTETRYNISEKIHSLEVGDTCLLLQEDKLIESKITSINEDMEKVQTYIFSLDKDKTFFANGILTHNKTIGGEDSPPASGVPSLRELAGILLKEQTINSNHQSDAYNIVYKTQGGYWLPSSGATTSQINTYMSNYQIPTEAREDALGCKFEKDSDGGFSIKDGEQWTYPMEDPEEGDCSDLNSMNMDSGVTANCHNFWVPEELTAQTVEWSNSPLFSSNASRFGGWAAQMNQLCVQYGGDENGTPISEL
jgi:hypothetical protein